MSRSRYKEGRCQEGRSIQQAQRSDNQKQLARSTEAAPMDPARLRRRRRRLKGSVNQQNKQRQQNTRPLGGGCALHGVHVSASQNARVRPIMMVVFMAEHRPTARLRGQIDVLGMRRNSSSGWNISCRAAKLPGIQASCHGPPQQRDAPPRARQR